MARAKNCSTDLVAMQHGCDVAGCDARAPVAHSKEGADAFALEAGWMITRRFALCPDHAAAALDGVGVTVQVRGADTHSALEAE